MWTQSPSQSPQRVNVMGGRQGVGQGTHMSNHEPPEVRDPGPVVLTPPLGAACVYAAGTQRGGGLGWGGSAILQASPRCCR